MSDQTVRRVAFALGSNQGDRLAMLQSALDRLADTVGLTLVAVSPVFETEPVGGPEQPDFLNAVVVGDSSLSPRRLLERALAVEQSLGRIRAERWGPRAIDIDLLAVGQLVVDEPDLKVPHPRVLERPFVVIPWVRADADAVLPGAALVADTARGLDSAGVRERPDLVLVLADASDVATAGTSPELPP